MVRPVVIALLATGAAAADTTFMSGTAEPSSALADAVGITTQSPAATVLPSMSTTRTSHTATQLEDGRVLIAGGLPSFITAELYEPAQRAFEPIADMSYGRRMHTATLLPAGLVLVAGGIDQSGIGLSAAELFIPASATFVVTHSMTTARAGQTATLLGTGHVLIAGGDYLTGNSAELFDPVTRTFTRTGTMNHGRVAHAAVLLTNGEVLITGGDAAGNTAEIFNPKTGRFSLTGSMLQSRHGHTATLISGGNVLITGGQWNTGIGSQTLSSAEIYEPASGRFFAVQAMSSGRAWHTATALADGTVLVAGGATRFAENPMGCFPLYFYWESGSVERFNPATRQFTLVSADSMPVSRSGHTPTRLPTGDVLVTGGTTLESELCYIVAQRRVFKAVPMQTATAELIR